MIYVDSPRAYPWTPLRHKVWSHLWSDTSDDDLHVFAAKLGLQRSWFQQKAKPDAPEAMKRFRNHYDVTPPKRDLALRLGVVAMEGTDYLSQQRLALVCSPRDIDEEWSVHVPSEESTPSDDELEASIVKSCPDCGARLVIRTNRATGGKFIGCARWPECDFREKLPESLKLRAMGAPTLF